MNNLDNSLVDKTIQQSSPRIEQQQQSQLSSSRNNFDNPKLDQESIPEVISQIQSPQHNRKVNTLILAAIILICLCALIMSTFNLQGKGLGIFRSSKSLPKIVWLYTYHKYQGQTAMNRIHFDYYNHTATVNGYEVRIVDSWTAYDWLSPQMTANITKTSQKTKIDQTVCSLLKLALLIEHGGIMLGNLQFLLARNDFSWIDKMFQAGENSSLYRLPPQMAEVYMPIIRPIPTFKYHFSEDIIAAVPQSKFLIEIFQSLQQVLITGKLPFNDIFKFMKHNQKVGVEYLPLSIASVMTVKLYEFNEGTNLSDPHHYYGIQSPIDKNYLMLEQISLFQQLLTLKDDEYGYLKGKDLVLNTFQRVRNAIDIILLNRQQEKIHNNSLIYRLLSVPQNQYVFLKPLPKREISLCIVFPDALEEKQVDQAKKDIEKQTYKNKNIVFFVKNQGNIQKYSQNNVTILPSSNNEVRNIQIALTQHCNPYGYAVLLKSGQTFNSDSALQKIAHSVEDRQILGASINLMINGSLHEAKSEYHNYSRSRDGTINPKLQIMNGILNHFRIFSINAFRYIPQLEWRDTYGVYLEDRIIIFQTLLELLATEQKVTKPDHRHKYLYTKRKYSDLFHFPSRAVIISPDIVINALKYQEVSLAQIQRTKYRFDVESIELSMVNCELWGVPFSKMLVFNKGTQFVPIDKKQGPELIPKMIHQAWLGGELPYAKKYFYDKTQRLYPNYKMVLWSEKNITRQNFPDSFDLMQTLLTYQRSGKSVYSKYATVTDLLRHELMYKYGGFWRDAGMNLFRPVFDQFLRYKLVIGGEVTIGFRWNQGMCFFGNQPRSEHLYRVSNYRNINRMRYYHYWAVTIAGPIDFRQVLAGDQEQDPRILIVHFEYFYPGQASHPYGDQCLKRKHEIQKGEVYEFQYKGWVKIPECQKNYPIAFGQDHNMFGVSWQDPQ